MRPIELTLEEMSKLVSEIKGDGQELLLLHGWGMNSGIWQGITSVLSQTYRVRTLDLPGYGENHSRCPSPYTLATLTSDVANSIEEPVVVVGWSLGGLVAQSLALHYPQKVAALVCVTSSPKFQAEEEWPGIQPDLLQAFAGQLRTDTAKTIDRFLAIQAMGAEHPKEQILRVRDLLNARPAPTQEALAGGLSILQQADLRQQLKHIACPNLWVFGRLDKLVPVSTLEQVERLLPSSRSALFPKASHAPFISHREGFLQMLHDFVKNL